MQPTYYATPAAPCAAPAKSFPDVEAALEHARKAADAHRGRLGRLAHPGGPPEAPVGLIPEPHGATTMKTTMTHCAVALAARRTHYGRWP